jgi:hypothetical protein
MSVRPFRALRRCGVATDGGEHGRGERCKYNQKLDIILLFLEFHLIDRNSFTSFWQFHVHFEKWILLFIGDLNNTAFSIMTQYRS